jgi:hypothetical protein
MLEFSGSDFLGAAPRVRDADCVLSVTLATAEVYTLSQCVPFSPSTVWDIFVSFLFSPDFLRMPKDSKLL